MKRLIAISLGLVSLISIQACQSNRKASNYNTATSEGNNMKFANMAAEASMATVKASGLALSNSKNQVVIQFAKAMINDYTQLTNDLRKLKLDTAAVDTVNGRHQLMIDSLGYLHAEKFDKAYMQVIINGHEEQITSFRNASTDKNTPTADFAKKTIPVLTARLDSARVINNGLK